MNSKEEEPSSIKKRPRNNISTKNTLKRINKKKLTTNERIKNILKLLRINDNFNITIFPVNQSTNFFLNNKNIKYYPIIKPTNSNISFSKMKVNNNQLMNGYFSSIFDLTIKNSENKYVIKILKNNNNLNIIKIEFYGLIFLYYLTYIAPEYKDFFANIYEIGIKLNGESNSRQLYSILEKFSYDGIGFYSDKSIDIQDKRFYFVQYTQQILYALNILHNKVGYVYLDLKPENILINLLKPGKIISKLTDFATAREIGEPIGINGTIEYVSPIIYYNERNGIYSKANIIFDWYSLGIILLITLDSLFLYQEEPEYKYFFPFFNPVEGIFNDVKCMQEKIKFCSNEEYYLLQKNLLIKFIDKIFQNISLITDEKLKKNLGKICQLSYLLLTSNNPFAKNNNHIANTQKFIESLLSTN